MTIDTKELEADRWQPIEIAPRSGKIILAWQTGKIPYICADVKGQWRSFSNEEPELTLVAPTHWMPLPSPPQATDKGEKQ